MKIVNDNTDAILTAKNEAIQRALNKIGMVAEGYAKALCPTDTGRLKNSITYATAEFEGQANYTDDNGNSYSDGAAKGTAEAGVVCIGTNVEYAPYVELGTMRIGERPFLRPAVENHIEKYKEVLESELHASVSM